MRLTDIVVVAWVLKANGLRFAGVDVTGIPFKLLSRGRVRQIADVGKGHGAPGLDPDTARSITVFHVAICNPDRVHSCGDRARGPGGGPRWRRGPQRMHLALQRECPHRIAHRTADPLVAAGGDGDILLAIHLIGDWWGIGPKARLKPP